MAMQAVKVKNEESQGGISAARARHRRESFRHDSRTRANFCTTCALEMKQVTWPSRDDVISTTTVVIATVFFFGVFLAVVDWLVQRGVTYIFKVFGV